MSIASLVERREANVSNWADSMVLRAEEGTWGQLEYDLEAMEPK